MKRVIIAALMLAFAARAQDAASWWGALAADTQASDTTDFGAWFHVDASAVSSFVLAPANGTNFVARWNDWRNNGLYAISNSASLPYVSAASQNGKNTLALEPYSSSAPFNHLRWSVVSSSIMAVFSVWRKQNTSTYTPLLGSTSLLDFHGSHDYLVFGVGHASAYIVAGTNRLDGVETPYASITAGPDFHIITVLPTGNLNADNFGLDRIYRSGGQSIAECLIFTNALPLSSVSNIESYLSTKWGIAITQ